MNIFLEELSRQYPKDYILLALDGASWHKSKGLIVPENIRLFYLPAYSPELNPDELLNNAAKGNVSRKMRAQNKEELQANLRSYLRSTQRRPERVKNFFKGKHVTYAQAG